METTLPRCTVYYDGACPLCRREVAHYRRQAGAADLGWIDASTCDADALGTDLDRRAALGRLHVRQADGALLSGAAAFAAIWRHLPSYVWLARLGSNRVTLKAMNLAYAAFLRIRPLWRRSAERAEPMLGLPPAVLADLRTDHAGEVGAVQIYRGILAVSRDRGVRAFAARHLATELLHLRRIRHWLPAPASSRLLPLWKMAGWVTGALPALLGPRAVFATIAAVERFVDRHYAAQVDRLADEPALAELRGTLEACRRDEVAHRDEAIGHLHARPGPLLRVWAAVVAQGSAWAVVASRRF